LDCGSEQYDSKGKKTTFARRSKPEETKAAGSAKRQFEFEGVQSARAEPNFGGLITLELLKNTPETVNAVVYMAAA
jgi:hypothetical protein